MFLVFCKVSCSFKIFVFRVVIFFLNVFLLIEEDEGDFFDIFEILLLLIVLMELFKVVFLYSRFWGESRDFWVIECWVKEDWCKDGFWGEEKWGSLLFDNIDVFGWFRDRRWGLFFGVIFGLDILFILKFFWVWDGFIVLELVLKVGLWELYFLK